MDLGIAGRKAIVCASSKGLGRACAMALARAGCVVIVNGRDAARAGGDGAARFAPRPAPRSIVVAGDLDARQVARRAARRLSRARHSRQQQRRPAAGAVRRADAREILRGVESNMLTPIALIQQVAPGMAQRRFGRIVNITSASVRAPIPGLDVSSGARAGLTAFVAASARALAKHNVTINSIQPGAFDTDRLRPGLLEARRSDGRAILRRARAEREVNDSRPPVRRAGRIRRSVRLSFERTSRLHRRPEYSHRRRRPFPPRSETVRCS